jgi:CubicO group peptidase (beta-lactamase class C family)
MRQLMIVLVFCRLASPVAGFTLPAAVTANPPEPTTVDSVKIHGALAANYSARHGGRAVLVMIDGRIMFERYDNGFGPETATHLHSATKAFWGPVIAAMIEDGLVDSFDEPAAMTIHEWKTQPRKSQITLRQLLSLNAGLIQDVINLQGHARATLAPDLYKHAIGVPALRRPGAVFQYGPSCYYVLGEIMKRKLAGRKQTPLDYLQQRILDPIGAKPDDWVHDASGNPHIPNGASLTAREWLKYGQWLCQGGEWKGNQIVRKDLLAELVKPSTTNAGHGLALWLNQPGGQGAAGVASQRSDPDDEAGWIYRGGHRDLFAALGAGKCRMYVIPSLKMVALRQADSNVDRFDDHTFLSLLLTGRVSESVPRHQPPRPESADEADDRPGNMRQAVQQMLKRFDSDGDDQLTSDEVGPRLRQSFDRFDVDGNDALDVSELEALLKAVRSRR